MMPFSVLNSIFSENALIVVKQQQPACRPPRSALLRKPAPGSPPVHTTPTQYALTSALILVLTGCDKEEDGSNAPTRTE